jgi:DNA transformation protein
MTARDGFARFVAEQMAAAGTTRLRRMFGGHGIYVDGIFVAIVADDRLFLKIDGETRAHFDARALAAFTYLRAGRPSELGYREAPPEVFESPDDMRIWVRRALEAALRAQARERAPARVRRRAPP